MNLVNRSRLVVALLCGVLAIMTAAPSFAAGVVVRRGVLGRQRVVVRQPNAQAIVVGPRHAAAIIAPQAVVVPQAFIAPQAVFVPQQQVIVGPRRASAIIIR